MEGQNPFSEISSNKDFGAFIIEAMTKAMAAIMSKMSKNIESSVQNMFFKSFMAHSAGDSRKRKNKDLSRQNDGALLTGEVSSPMTEDEMPPGPPSQEGNSEQVSGKRKSKTKNTLAAPKQVVISHISDTDDDVGDMDDMDDDSDVTSLCGCRRIRFLPRAAPMQRMGPGLLVLVELGRITQDGSTPARPP
ncbi:hypothetical protein NDU88_006375 [Pleurodeles waltl]|uniref:Uncharacterized protein n=1 Tax=Pleurodeles waltl TaxID=8319 RepID=A0AAV7QLT1_PLEWA|nr:hypothetical protein NDU88_006375 [Pleurodeles waltl]